MSLSIQSLSRLRVDSTSLKIETLTVPGFLVMRSRFLLRLYTHYSVSNEQWLFRRIIYNDGKCLIFVKASVGLLSELTNPESCIFSFPKTLFTNICDINHFSFFLGCVAFFIKWKSDVKALNTWSGTFVHKECYRSIIRGYELSKQSASA